MEELASFTTAPEVRCQTCAGRGLRANGRPCSSCRGAGHGRLLDGYIVVWGTSLTRSWVREEYFRLALRRTMHVISFGIAFSCLLVFVLGTIEATSRGEPFYEILVDTGRAGALFWIGVLAFLYIYFALDREADSIHRVPRRRYVPGGAPLNNWEIDFRKYPRLDLWRALTFSAKSTILMAARQAYARGREPDAAHLLAASLSHESARFIFGRLGIRSQILRDTLERVTRSGRFTPVSIPEIVAAAYVTSYRERRAAIDVGYLIATISRLDTLSREVLYSLQVSSRDVENVLAWYVNEERFRSSWQHITVRARLRPRNHLDRAMTAIATPTLDHFSTDYTELAQWGQLLPAVSREEILKAVLRVINAGTSVLLVGNPGVGKGGVLEDLAERMVANDVPQALQDKRLVSVSLSKLVGGITPAEAEGRLLTLLDEAQRAGNVVVVFEEIQGLLGITSGHEGSIDLGAVLASSLSRSGLLSIATTTPEAFRRSVETSALGQSFERVLIEEPSVDECIRMLELRVGFVEYQYRVYYSYRAIVQLVDLSARFIHDRALPKKALALLDELALFVRERKGEQSVILAADVDAFMAMKFNIPVATVTDDESSKLLSLEARLHERVVGQDEAIREVANAIRRARTDVRDRKRPIASFLFLGPTGVGKTELAKALAGSYFGDETKMVRLDMSEYQQLESLSRLVGAAGQHGVLTEAIRRSPFALVLLDELEKAHHDIINVFLQVLDDGRLTDGLGQTVDCTNTIIIATSNAASSYIQEAIAQGRPYQDIERQLVQEQLRPYFQPELMNRFDGVVVFRPLNTKEVSQITELMLESIGEQLEREHGIHLKVQPEAIGRIVEKGFDVAFGARPLRRYLQDNISSEIAKLILAHRVERRDTIEIGVEGLRVVRAQPV